jgi:hypothetical protein
MTNRRARYFSEIQGSSSDDLPSERGFHGARHLAKILLRGGRELINPNQLALIDQLVHEQAGRCAGNGDVECDNPLGDDASLDETNVGLLCARCHQAAYGPKQGSIDAGDGQERRAA